MMIMRKKQEKRATGHGLVIPNVKLALTRELTNDLLLCCFRNITVVGETATRSTYTTLDYVQRVKKVADYLILSENTRRTKECVGFTISIIFSYLLPDARSIIEPLGVGEGRSYEKKLTTLRVATNLSTDSCGSRLGYLIRVRALPSLKNTIKRRLSKKGSRRLNFLPSAA